MEDVKLSIDQYSINILMDTDSSSHIAIIKKSYEEDDVDRIADVSGAQIYVNDGTQRINFVEFDNPDYPANDLAKYYYRIDDWSPEFSKNYTVSVLLPDGLELSSAISVFKRFSFVSSGSDKIVPPANPDQPIITINWEDYSKETFFDSKLFIIYPFSGIIVTLSSTL